MTTTAGWSALLDALEERNRRHEGVLRGDPSPVPEVPLEAPGPLPAALAERATAVLARTRRLEQLAQTRTALARQAAAYERD